MKTVLYFFSGTGNSLKIAQDLQAQLGETELIRICEANRAADKTSAVERIGFVFPVYVRGLPHMVKKYVENLQIGKDKYIFAVANYGNCAALSFFQLNNILAGKGTELSAMFGVAMPGNMWFMYYPHPEQEFIDRINAQPDATFAIARQIENNAQVSIRDSLADHAADEERYHNFVPHTKDMDFWTTQKCNGCGTCIKICPANNIRLVNNKPAWQHRCEFCLACLHWCPQEAIEYKQDSTARDRYQHPAIKVHELFCR